MIRLATLAASAVALLLGVPAPSARAQGLIDEIKVGVLIHDVGGLWSGFSLEPDSADIHIYATLRPHLSILGGELRPAIGGSINTVGATSRAYLDARWEIQGPAQLFFSIGIGAAIHDGKLGPSEPDRKALGSRVLFHFPAEIGWRWDGHNSVSVYFEHVSNGYTQDYNEALDAIGVRYGYKF